MHRISILESNLLQGLLIVQNPTLKNPPLSLWFGSPGRVSFMEQLFQSFNLRLQVNGGNLLGLACRETDLE